MSPLCALGTASKHSLSPDIDQSIRQVKLLATLRILKPLMEASLYAGAQIFVSAPEPNNENGDADDILRSGTFSINWTEISRPSQELLTR
jgi:hypothetical protein